MSETKLIKDVVNEWNNAFENIKEAMEDDIECERNIIVRQHLNETGEKWGVRIGSKLVSNDVFATREDADYYISKRPFKIMFALMCAVAETIYEEKQQKK